MWKLALAVVLLASLTALGATYLPSSASSGYLPPQSGTGAVATSTAQASAPEAPPVSGPPTEGSCELPFELPCEL